MTPNTLSWDRMVRYGVQGVLYQIRDNEGVLRVEGFAQTLESVLPLLKLFDVRMPLDAGA